MIPQIRKIKIEAKDEVREVSINVQIVFDNDLTRDEQENRRLHISNELHDAMRRCGFDCEQIEYFK